MNLTTDNQGGILGRAFRLIGGIRIGRVLLCVGFAGSLLATAARAQVEPIDSVAAVVNDNIIMLSQVERRIAEVVNNIERQNIPMPPQETLVREVMEQLILESIQLQLADRAGVRIDDTSLNQTMEQIAARNNMTLAQFQQALAAEGASYEQMREQVRQEMITARVQEGIVRRRISVTDQEIKNFLESEAGQAQLQPEYRIAHLLIQVPESADPDQWETLGQKAEALREQLSAGANFQQAAATLSDAPNAAAGGDLGWLKQSDLPSLFRNIAPQLEINQVSEPIRGGNGFHILKLLAKRGGDTVIVPQYRVRHILIQPSEIRSEEATRELAAELRDRIKAGEDFGALAKRYSADTGSLASGGTMDWMTLADFVPEFSAVVEASEPNEISEPFQSRFGWHIVEVLEQRQQDMGTAIKRRRAEDIIAERKFEEELDIWLREERAQAYVDVKIY